MLNGWQGYLQTQQNQQKCIHMKATYFANKVVYPKKTFIQDWDLRIGENSRQLVLYINLFQTKSTFPKVFIHIPKFKVDVLQFK